MQVTDCQDIVLTQDAMESVSMGGLFTEIKKIIQEKNLYKEVNNFIKFVDNILTNLKFCVLFFIEMEKCCCLERIRRPG